MNRPVTSREYKLILAADRFLDRERGTAEFLRMLEFVVAKSSGKVCEVQNEETSRETWYLDTADASLRRRGFALRIRDEGRKYKVTLKLREPDRYLAAATELATTAEGPEWKFEEDILPPFRSGFAHSVSFETKKLPRLATLADLVAMCPSITLGASEATPLVVVNGFTAQEHAVKLVKIRFGNSQVVKLALSFWYLRRESNEYPIVAECSFDYDQPDDAAPDVIEDFPADVVTGTNMIFRTLQRQAGWFDLSSTTKTAAAYDVL